METLLSSGFDGRLPTENAQYFLTLLTMSLLKIKQSRSPDFCAVNEEGLTVEEEVNGYIKEQELDIY